MSEPLHIGTRGWDYDAWQDSFYDAAMPREWRFCYFSNAIRAVVVPAAQWHSTGPAEIGQWMEDGDPGFRFVTELPDWFNEDAVPDRQRLADHLALCDGLRPRLAARLWRTPETLPSQPKWWSARLAAVADDVPLCIDLHGRHIAGEVRALLRERNVSQCWHPQYEPRPQPEGRYLVALMGGGADLKTLRQVVETLAGWGGATRSAGLFFDEDGPTGNAPRLAREARLIAELLGV